MAKCFQLACVVCLAFVQTETVDHRFFLGQIIQKYGHNGTISYEGFERLYTNLGLGTSSPSTVVDEVGSKLSRTGRHVSDFNSSETQEELEKLVSQHNEIATDPINVTEPRHCLSPRELLAIYGVTYAGVGSLSAVSFLHICPAIVYELDQRTCTVSEEHAHSHGLTTSANSNASWLFACFTILVISISGLLCVAVVPLLQKSFISQLISFLVALAVGTLLGDAFLHLIPHALESNFQDAQLKHTDSLMKTGAMFLTVVFFFTFEAVLNTRRNKEEGQMVQEKVSFVPVKLNGSEKEMLEMESQHIHSHSHSHNHNNNTALMVIMGDGLHNLTDGLAIGAAFSGGLAPGFATAVAVFTHELPHELGDFAVLLQSGVTVRKAMLYNLLSSVLSFLGTVIGLVIGNFGDMTQWIYAITAGSFIYIALSNLVPEINRQKCTSRTILLRLSGILCGGGLMGCIALFEHNIYHMFT